MRILFMTLLAALSSAGANARPSPAMQADTHGCRLLVPVDLGGGPTTWIGDCRGGRADGLGVIRVGGAGAPRLFAGLVRAGRPVAGYLDTGSADSAGPSLHFQGGDGLPTRNHAEAQQACTIASRGALAAAARYRAMHNPASARFYDGWAATLRRCEGNGE